jgi:hypothetical protein
MNATHFFERREGDRTFPTCSESFWSTVFSFFLLHIAREKEGDCTLRVWQPTERSGPPWYEPKPTAHSLDPHGLTFQDVAVEPNTLVGVWPEIDIAITGIAPDLMLRFDRGSGYEYVFVETKVTSGAHLNSNQLSSYPSLIKSLAPRGTKSRLFILKSIGCSTVLYNETRRLARDLGDRFGILLWEEIFRAMHAYGFSLPGLTGQMLEAYTDAGNDCESW